MTYLERILTHVYMGTDSVERGLLPKCKCGWVGKPAWDRRMAAAKFAAHCSAQGRVERARERDPLEVKS